MDPKLVLSAAQRTEEAKKRSYPETGREVGRLHYRFTPQMIL